MLISWELRRVLAIWVSIKCACERKRMHDQVVKCQACLPLLLATESWLLKGRSAEWANLVAGILPIFLGRPSLHVMR